MRRHRLVVVDRGVNHVHRWKGRCDCGCRWVSRHRRRKKEVVKQYRQYVKGQEAIVRARATFTLVRPKPTTPLSQLPEALRTPASTTSSYTSSEGTTSAKEALPDRRS